MRDTTAQPRAVDLAEWAHEFLSLAWHEVGEMLGTNARAVQRWRKGTLPSRDARIRLGQLENLRF